MDIDHIDIVSMLWKLICIQLTITMYFILLGLAKICTVKDDPYLRIMTSLNKDSPLEINDGSNKLLHVGKKCFSLRVGILLQRMYLAKGVKIISAYKTKNASSKFFAIGTTPAN